MPGAPHRRERTNDVPSVAGGGESGIQHGDDAAVGRRADQAAARLRQQHRRPWQVDLAERRRAEQLAARRQQRIVGPGERDPVDHDERERRPGDVDALEQPGGREQAGLVVGGERAHSAGLGRSRWVRIVYGTVARTAAAASSIARQLVNRASVRPPAAVMSAASSSCTAGAELLGPRVGEVPGAVQERVRRVVERAADVGDVGSVGRQAERCPAEKLTARRQQRIVRPWEQE